MREKEENKYYLYGEKLSCEKCAFYILREGCEYDNLRNYHYE